MNGIDQPEHGCRQKMKINLFVEELSSLVEMELTKADDTVEIISAVGKLFLDLIKQQGVDADEAMAVLNEHLLPSRPTLTLAYSRDEEPDA